MSNIFISRRSASVGVLLTIVSISRAANSPSVLELTGSPIASPEPSASDILAATKWGDDDTRRNLADALTKFLGNETGPYMDLSQETTAAQIQSNGEYLLSDQLKLPLMGVAMQRIDKASGHHIYPAFIHHNPMTRVFLLADDQSNVLAVAYADTMDVRKDGLIIGIVPRITIFYRTLEAPKELQDVAVRQMTDYYKAFGPDTTTVGYDIHIFERRLAPAKVEGVL